MQRIRRLLCPLWLGLFLTASWFAPTLAEPASPDPTWDGNAGVLAVLPWAQPDPARLQPFAKEAWLLFHNQDLALLLLPADLALSPALDPDLQVIEPASAESGDYYIVLLRDAQQAEFAGNARVLLRQGHSVLVWSPAGAPELTAASRAAQSGLVQPVRVPVAPRKWPRVADTEAGDAVGTTGVPAGPPAPDRARTEFDPQISQIVADVSQSEYVAVWQDLDDFETRYYNTASNEAAANYMYDLFDSLGLQAEFHTYNQSGVRKNVVGILPGLVHPERVVYITGHFDSISEDSQNHAPGADDNASGTAAFLEAARVLRNYVFEYTIKFVGFNGEEQGLVGSDAYVDMIAAQGEDVVACYNFDMIAYAGTDPAPPDLIIYTNSASLGFANILRDACLEFVPTHVEPVIVQQTLSGSDHYSFWTHDYEAVLGIEDEAWGDDFCPWYHTSNDRIERYPQDFPTYCAMAGIAAVAHTAIPIQAETFLVLDDETWDDDASGASAGNGNGILEYGETVELTLALRNVGLMQAENVQGTLLCDDPYVTVTAGQAAYGAIPSQGSASNATPFVLSVDAGIPDGHAIPLRLAVTEDPDTLELPQEVPAPVLAIVGAVVDDAAGDDDGIAEPGEVVELTLVVANGGGAAIADVWGTLVAAGPYLEVEAVPQSYGTLGTGGQASGVFTVTVDAGAPALYAGTLHLEIEGPGDYALTLAHSFYIGDVFAEDMEAGEGGWTHYSGGSGTDQWHLESYRNHTYAGATSWKCGGTGSANYSNLVHAVLQSPVFALPEGSQVTFHHWMNAEISVAYPGYCYDGGVIEISIDGGAWERLTPEGGYPYLIRAGGTPGPFPAGTPVFSGAHDWQMETLDLSAYAGSARLRFVFGSDGATTREGWYVDDVQLQFAPSDAHPDVAVTRLMLHPARPNPTPGTTRVFLDLPKRERVEVRVYDIAGRCIGSLCETTLAAGRHAFAWDGRDARQQPAHAGVYWIRVRAGAEELMTRVVRIR